MKKKKHKSNVCLMLYMALKRGLVYVVHVSSIVILEILQFVIIVVVMCSGRGQPTIAIRIKDMILLARKIGTMISINQTTNKDVLIIIYCCLLSTPIAFLFFL